MSAYFEALEAHNEAHDPKASKDVNLNSNADRLRKLMKARNDG